MIGKIKEGIGFIPNNKKVYEEEISILEYGQYAIVIKNTQSVLEELKKHFNVEDAVKIYITGIIHFVNGFTYKKDIIEHYEMSMLSAIYPKLNMGYSAISKLYDALGR